MKEILQNRESVELCYGSKKKKHIIAQIKQFRVQLLLVILLLVGANSDAFAQCNYVINENNKETKTNIPCNFPIKVTTENYSMDQSIFDKQLVIWHKQNPRFANLNLIPKSNFDNRWIEIPVSDYDKLTVEEKKTVTGISYFYKVIKP